MAIAVQQRWDIVPTALAVKAMRDSGYRNAAYAIAELMDNSIQAGADRVELLCADSEEPLQERTRRRIKEIAVLDNGSGMDAEKLRKALQFGNGTHLDDRSGMGRFGMGLPSSSISQCRRVDVWSWQNGADDALHSYLDLDSIEKGDLLEVPDPAPKSIPSRWRKTGKTFHKSGTLVVWSLIDRSMWRTSAALIENSEFLIGRIYRHFLNDGSVVIRLASFLASDPSTSFVDKFALPNDPLYLMAPTDTPAPFGTKPMFESYGENWEVPITIRFKGEDQVVTLRFSHATREARPDDRSGARPHGVHARKNIGVSVIRSGREITLDEGWAIQYDPTERWWGVEVDYPPALDELFGLINNKQEVTNFSKMASLDIESLLKGKTVGELKEEWALEGDPKGPLLEIAHRINSTLSQIRKLLKASARGSRAGRRRYDLGAEAKATAATRDRQAEGQKGQSDEGESLPSEEREHQLEKELEEKGVTPEKAKELAATTVSEGLKYVFATADLETQAFFSVKPTAGTIFITLNGSHPAYEHLVGVLEDAGEANSLEELKDRLHNAYQGLKLLLSAWARYEDEQFTERARSQAMDIRTDWGRIARDFLEDEE